MGLSGAKMKFRFEILGSDFFPAYFISALQDLMHANPFKAQLQLSLGNSGYVEQIVNEPCFQFDVTPNDLKCFPEGRESGNSASSSPTIAITGESGLRSSCDSNARNWSFAALAPINSCRSVTSRVLSSTR